MGIYFLFISNEYLWMELLGSVSFHSSPKECSNYCTIVLISHAIKVMFKMLQTWIQQ